MEWNGIVLSGIGGMMFGVGVMFVWKYWGSFVGESAKRDVNRGETNRVWKKEAYEKYLDFLDGLAPSAESKELEGELIENVKTLLVDAVSGEPHVFGKYFEWVVKYQLKTTNMTKRIRLESNKLELLASPEVFGIIKEFLAIQDKINEDFAQLNEDNMFTTHKIMQLDALKLAKLKEDIIAKMKEELELL